MFSFTTIISKKRISIAFDYDIKKRMRLNTAFISLYSYFSFALCIFYRHRRTYYKKYRAL